MSDMEQKKEERKPTRMKPKYFRTHHTRLIIKILKNNEKNDLNPSTQMTTAILGRSLGMPS